MGKCPQPVTDSNQTPDSSKTSDSVDNTNKIGYSFRVIPVEDTRVLSQDNRLMPVEDKPKTSIQPKTTVGFKPEVVTISTKKPVKL